MHTTCHVVNAYTYNNTRQNYAGCKYSLVLIRLAMLSWPLWLVKYLDRWLTWQPMVTHYSTYCAQCRPTNSHCHTQSHAVFFQLSAFCLLILTPLLPVNCIVLRLTSRLPCKQHKSPSHSHNNITVFTTWCSAEHSYTMVSRLSIPTYL